MEHPAIRHRAARPGPVAAACLALSLSAAPAAAQDVQTGAQGLPADFSEMLAAKLPAVEIVRDDGRRLPAEFVGADPATAIALPRAEAGRRPGRKRRATPCSCAPGAMAPSALSPSIRAPSEGPARPRGRPLRS